MSTLVPSVLLDMLEVANSSWQPILKRGLEEISHQDPNYLSALVRQEYLPSKGRIFAAFSIPLESVRYVLIGEGPYPRAESATGVCFMDGAVESLWSDKGLSKQVNRATSLRNFIKMLLVADDILEPRNTSGEALAEVVPKIQAADSPFIHSLTELQANLTMHGFLLLNATLVYRSIVPPLKEAKAWRPFMKTILEALAEQSARVGNPLPVLVLWGKIAEQLESLHLAAQFPKAISEHPYNLSFILNSVMQALFKPMHLLHKQK